MHHIVKSSDVIGMVGVVIVLATYLLLQIDKMSKQNVWFSGLNVIGSVCILVSLYYSPNLASIVIEVSWLAISMYGLWLCLIQRRGNDGSTSSRT